MSVVPGVELAAYRSGFAASRLVLTGVAPAEISAEVWSMNGTASPWVGRLSSVRRVVVGGSGLSAGARTSLNGPPLGLTHRAANRPLESAWSGFDSCTASALVEKIARLVDVPAS